MALRYVVFLAFVAITVPSYLPSKEDQVLVPDPLPRAATSFHHRRQSGNSDAASDLYGLGLRISAYLQIVGMLLSCLRTHHRTLVGIKLLSSAVCVALLGSLTALLAQQSISPCESWLVLSLINAYGTARSAAINETGKQTGGIAFLFSAISVVWQDVLFLWFWGTLYRDLPSLRTKDAVWIFTMVDVKGGFRIVMLFYSCLCTLILPLELVEYLKLGATRFRAWTEGTQEDEPDDERTDHYSPSPTNEEPINSRLEKIWGRPVRKLSTWFLNLQSLSILVKVRDMRSKFWCRVFGITSETTPSELESRLQKGRKVMRIGRCLFGFAILILTIAGVEEII